MKRNTQLLDVRCSTRRFSLLCCLLAGLIGSLYAQSCPTEQSSEGWYIGVDGGVPFGYAAFQSIGSDQTHAGLAIGVSGGYRFSSLLAADLTFRISRLTMTATDCCTLSHLSMEAWYLDELKSEVNMQEFMAQGHLNLLEFIPPLKGKRWSLELSPRLGACLTKTNIRTKADGKLRLKGAHRWHLAAGGQVEASRRFSPRVSLGIYTGMTFLTGRHIDNIPTAYHRSNYVWESGLRLTYTLSSGKEDTP